MSNHWYTKDGVARYDASKRDARKHGYYPSVTTVIKIIRSWGLDKWIKEQGYLGAELIKRLPNEDDESWFARVDEEAGRIAKEAAESGNLFHDTIEKHLALMKENASLDVEYEWPLEIKGWQPHFENYAKQYIGGIIDVEKILVSNSMGLAGKSDLLYRDTDEGFAITDWKSQNVRSRPSFYDTWIWQLGGYADMAKDISGELGKPKAITVVIDRNKPSPFIRKVWTDEQTEHGLQTLRSIAETWRLTEKFDPREVDSPY